MRNLMSEFGRSVGIGNWARDELNTVLGHERGPSGRFWGEKNFLPLTGIEPLYLGFP